jgi:hypothetical protein
MMKRPGLLSLLFNCFPFVRTFKAYRLRRKVSMRKVKICRKLKKEEPTHLRRYVVMSGTIRRL